MGIPIVVATNGYGQPITEVTNGYGTPVEVATNGYGVPVVIVASGGLPVVGSGGGAPAYAAESELIFAAFTTPPTTGRKDLIDAVVVALKAAGVWTKLDALHVMAAADSQAAKINWKAPGTYNLTEVNAPAFTANSGFLGAATKALDTSFNPTTAPSPKFVRDSATLSGWSVSDIDSSISMVVQSVGWNLIQQRAAGAYYTGLNNTGFVSAANLNGSGFFGVSRTSSSSISFYRNGSLLNSHTDTSVAVSNATIQYLNGWPGTIAAGAHGSQLNATEQLALHNALRTYMTGVGVP